MVLNKSSKKKIPSFFLTAALSLSLVFPPFVLAQSQEIVESHTNSDNNVFLYPGDLITVKVKALTRVAIANPGIVDITNATADEITLVGRKVGETQIFVWEAGIKRQIIARVLANDLNLISDRITSLIQSAGIKGVSFEKNYYEGKIILSGSLSKNEKKKFQEIIKNFSENIIDLVIEEGDLIQIDVQFSELDTTLTKEMGIDWLAGDGFSFKFSETLPRQDGGFADLFKIGNFARTSAILSVVNLLIKEGRGRVLSKPSLVVTNGEEASFLVGGEVPIRSTTTSVGGGSVQENISFKSYGVELTVTPELRDGKIDIKVNVTVRDIDGANGGSGTVAFLTRTATTKVRLSDAQTIVLAGMIQRRQSRAIRRVPFLSKIPVLGLLFKSEKMPSPDSDQELVVSLTPRILKSLPASKSQEISADQSANKVGNKSQKNNEKAILSDESKNESKKTNAAPLVVEDVQAPVTKLNAEPKMVEPKVVETVKVEPPLTAAQKKAAERKAKADAKAAAAKLKKEKAEKDKRAKEEKVRAQKSAKNSKKSAKTKSKIVKEVAKKEPPTKSTVKNKSESIQKTDTKVASSGPSEDPNLNMALDDPRQREPQNVLSDDEIKTIKDKYSKKITAEMAETISYPYEAKESRWEGTAVINITILPDGNVKNVAVSQSSGYTIFDKDAVDTAEILSPFDPFNPAKNLRELQISVPVEYSEKAILGTPALEKK